LTKQPFQDRNLRQAGDTAQLLGLLIFHDAADEVGFTVAQANFMFDFALADDGLADAADVLLACHSRHVH
jgi:hypothetical protein